MNLPSPHTCDQCGLNYASGGVRIGKGDATLHFCCSGCAVTNTVLGASREEGDSAIFLARLGLSAFLSMNIMAVSWMLYDEGLTTFGLTTDVIPAMEALLFVLSIPIMILVGFPFAKATWRELRTRSVSTDSLIAFGSFAAFFFSSYQLAIGARGIYFDTATMTLVLVTFGRYIEANAKERARQSLTSLIGLQPQKVRVIRKGDEALLDAKEARIDETMRVLAGERFPLDGVIVEGATTVDASALTGESLPRPRKPGDTVLAATMNIDGSVLVRITALSTDTAHMQAVKLLEQARASRSSLQQTVDRISGIFLPSVITGSIIAAVVWSFFVPLDKALLIGLTVLVVSCPCALGIGTPLALTFALNRAAREGILLRTHSAFERLKSVTQVLFDKTGTLTTGELTVRKWVSTDSMDNSRRVVAGLEAHATHPIGKAIFAHAAIASASLPKAKDVRVIPGKGIEGTVSVNGRSVHLSIIHSRDQRDTPGLIDLRARGRARRPNETEVLVMKDGQPHALIFLSDTLRPDAVQSISMLREKGLKTAILSGDNRSAVERTAAEAGVAGFYAELLPAQKLAKIAEFRATGPVAMVGDGINDAPSLAAADIGIALAGGTDIAKEEADVVIIGDKLSSIPWLLTHARRTVGVIRWNLFWAFGYNVVAIVLAVAGVLQPVWAAGAMVVSSVSIIAHSRRAGR